MTGWVKLHRKMVKWEWFKTPHMYHLFSYLLLTANREKKIWHGVEILRGQLVTGRKELSQNTGISQQSIRTCLKRLKSTSELTVKSTNKYSIITICNYETYQITKTANQPANQPAKTPITNHKQEVKEIKNKGIGTFENVFLSEKELKKLKEKFNSQCEEKINTLSEGIASKGYKYKSHYATILAWDRKEKKNQPKPQKVGGYTF